MAKRYTDDFIERLKGAIPIVQVAEALGFQPEFAGGDLYKMHCTHPGDRNPSLMLYTNTNSYHCFGCEQSGDIISFVQFLENEDFHGAVRVLCEIGNITPVYNTSYVPVPNPLNDELNRYHSLLLTNEPMLQYLIGRGLDLQDIIDYKLGLSIRTNPDLVIPIFGPMNNLQGFSYRHDHQPKYVYDPRNTCKVTEGLLFGLNQAKRIKAPGYGHTAVLVEGFFDAMLLQKHKVPAVCLCGCKITDAQIDILAKYYNKFVVFMDGDLAGQNGTRKIAAALKAKQSVSEVWAMYYNGDPDDLAKSLHACTGAYILNNKVSVPGYEIHTAITQAKSDIDHIVLGSLMKLIPVLKDITDPLEREYYINTIAEALKLNADFIGQYL